MFKTTVQFCKRVAPLSLKIWLKDGVRRIGGVRYVWRLNRSGLTVPSGKVAVCYGGMAAEAPDGIVHGGRVKLIHLREAFPENDGEYNILYLVSSASPDYAEELVFWAKDRGVKLVWNQNGVAYPAWAGQGYEKINRPMKKLIHMADHVVYQSRFCLHSADRYLGQVNCPNSVIYNYVDTDMFTPAPAPEKIDRWELLSVGTHAQRYRVMSALETVAGLSARGRDVRLTFAGKMAWPGAQKDTLEAAGKLRVEDKIRTLPAFTRERAPEIYRRAHILIHTQYNDSCPTVVLESIASGLPVAGSASGGMPELVRGGAGELVDAPLSWDEEYAPGAERMADAVETIMDDWGSYSRRARDLAVRKFGKRLWLKLHDEIFNSLV